MATCFLLQLDMHEDRLISKDEREALYLTKTGLEDTSFVLSIPQLTFLEATEAEGEKLRLILNDKRGGTHLT